MSLFAASFNVFMYLSLFVILWRKNHRVDVCGWLALIYLIVAALCLNTYCTSPLDWNLSVFNFVYLFVVILFFFIPLSNGSRIDVKFNPINDRTIGWYKIFSFFYICISLFSCIIYYPQFESALINPEWSDLYEASHEVKESNIFTKFANLFFHLRYLGVVLFFSFLLKRDSRRIFLLLLGAGAFLPLVFVTVANASRGGVLRLGFSIFLSYIMFREILPKHVKRVIYMLLIASIPLAIIYFWVVSISRFDSGVLYGGVENSLMYYAGHSMLCFNYGVMDSITGFANGGYMFDTDGVNNIRGTHFGTDFMTFVGCIYMDFGFFVTLLLAIMVCGFMNSFIKKSHKGISEYFVMLTYIMFLFDGVFVLPRGFAVQWIETIIIYLLLKAGENVFRPSIKYLK